MLNKLIKSIAECGYLNYIKASEWREYSHKMLASVCRRFQIVDQRGSETKAKKNTYV